MSGKTKNAERLTYILISVLLAVIYKKAAATPVDESGLIFGFNYNLFVYIVSLLVAFLVFLILMLLIDRLSKTLFWTELPDPEQRGKGGIAKRVLYIIYIAVCVTALIFIYKIYTSENNLYPFDNAVSFLRQEVPHPAYFAVITALTLVLYFSLKTKQPAEENVLLRFGLMPIFAFFSAMLVYCPNILKDNGAGTLHIHAVTNSIINIMHGAPYNDINCSIYGHYGLFLTPISFLLGGRLNGVMLSLAVCAFIAFFAAFYTAHKLIKNNVVYVLTVFAITGTTTLLTRRGQYFQINPLRLLWPAVTLALIAYSVSHTQTRRQRLIRILELIVGTCSVVWNFETGLFCVFLIAVVRIYRALYTDPFFSRHTFRTILYEILYGIGCLALAFLTVGIYNLLAGGEFGTVKQFIYPLMSGTYNVNHLRTDFPGVSFLYFFEILAFFLSALICLRRQAAHRCSDYVSETILFAVSVSGLLQLIYFMNRAAYGNMSIAHMQFALCLGFWGSKALEAEGDTLKESLGTPSRLLGRVLLVILFGCSVVLAVEGGSYIQIAADLRVKSSWNTESLEETLEEIKKTVPENTFAFGTYVPELYAALGWDTGCYMTDWSDINELNWNYALTEAQSRDCFFSSADGLILPDYEVTATIPVGNLTFHLFEKK